MSYLSDNALNWLATQIAGLTFGISAHTDEPGNAGTGNEVTAGNYARATLAANAITATGATADNDANFTIFTPNAAAAGQVVTHIGYWRGGTAGTFFGWVALRAPVTTVEGEDLRIAAGTMDFTASLVT